MPSIIDYLSKYSGTVCLRLDPDILQNFSN